MAFRVYRSCGWTDSSRSCGDELVDGRYRLLRNRRHAIPKDGLVTSWNVSFLAERSFLDFITPGAKRTKELRAGSPHEQSDVGGCVLTGTPRLARTRRPMTSMPSFKRVAFDCRWKKWSECHRGLRPDLVLLVTDGTKRVARGGPARCSRRRPCSAVSGPPTKPGTIQGRARSAGDPCGATS